jgi:hypothetical protein
VAQRRERDRRVETVAELRREHAPDLGHLVAGLLLGGEADRVRASSPAPAFVVMMMMTLRKSALRPLLSVSVPWSITCSRMLKMSGCAFSISSRAARCTDAS